MQSVLSHRFAHSLVIHQMEFNPLMISSWAWLVDSMLIFMQTWDFVVARLLMNTCRDTSERYCHSMVDHPDRRHLRLNHQADKGLVTGFHIVMQLLFSCSKNREHNPYK